MKRTGILSAALAFVLSVTVAGCGNEADDPDKLAGSVWVSQQDEVIITLSFPGDSLCTVMTARNDDTYSANLTAYGYRYTSAMESIPGLFHIFAGGDTGKRIVYYGFIRDKQLLLKSADDGTDIWFRREKK